MDLIKLENLAKYYKSGNGVSRGIQKVNLSFNLNEFVVVAGESGGGKTTLLNVIAGLDTFEEGEMYFNGEATSGFLTKDWEAYRANYVGFVFQNYNIIDSLSVYQNVLLALEVQNYKRSERRKRALELIKQVGLYNRRKNRAIKLSGGEKQRLSIARALAKDSTILVCDEPTGNLDSKTGEQIIKLIHEISKDKLVVIVSHNIDQVKEYATKIVTIHDGLVHEVKEIKKVSPTQVNLTEQKHKRNIIGLLSLSWRLLIQTPKRFLFTLFFHIIVSFVLVYLLTGSIYTMSGSTYLFPNFRSPSNRLVINKKDGSSFTATEISELNDFKHVIGIYTNPDRFIVNDFEFMAIDTTKSIIPHFLEGRLPQNHSEIVISPSQSWHQPPIGSNVSVNINGIQRTFTVVGKYNSNYTGVAYVHEDLLVDPNINYANLHEIIVVGESAIHTRQLISRLNANFDNLRIIYDYSAGSLQSIDNIFNLINVVGQVVAIIILGLFLYSLVYTITKNTMATKRKDIAILRSIGYTKSDMGLATLFEQIYLLVLAVIVSFLVLFYISLNNFQFYLAFNYLSFYHYILFIMILLLLTVRLSNRYNHRLFNLSIIENLVQVGEEV